MPGCGNHPIFIRAPGAERCRAVQEGESLVRHQGGHRGNLLTAIDSSLQCVALQWPVGMQRRSPGQQHGGGRVRVESRADHAFWRGCRGMKCARISREGATHLSARLHLDGVLLVGCQAGEGETRSVGRHRTHELTILVDVVASKVAVRARGRRPGNCSVSRVDLIQHWRVHRFRA